MLPRSFTLLFLLLLSCLQSFAQGDTVEYYLNYSNQKCEPYMAYYYRMAVKDGSGWNVKDYYLKEQTLQMTGRYNDDSLKVMHGTFLSYHPNGKLKSKIRYLYGKKDGAVRRFDILGNMIDSAYYKDGIPCRGRKRLSYEHERPMTGIYDDSGSGTGREWHYYRTGELEEYGVFSEGYRKDSIWSYYYKNGKVSSLEYFDKGEFKKRECFDELGRQQADCDSSSMPVFTKHGGNFNLYLGNAIKFPGDYEITKNGKGYVLVRFYVDETGSCRQPELLKGLHPAFDSQVLDAIKHSPKWTPGIYHNHEVSVYYTLPVSFKMTD
jgi:antitoxin component YwqK of YwqJK toxin-antitoxin module